MLHAMKLEYKSPTLEQKSQRTIVVIGTAGHSLRPG